MSPSLSLLLAIGEVDDCHLECGAIRPFSVKPQIRRWVVAACALLTVICTVVFIWRHDSAVPPSEESFIGMQIPAPQTITTEELAARADVIVVGTVVEEHRIEGIAPESPFVSSNQLMSVPHINASYEHTVTILVSKALKGSISAQNHLTVSNEAHDAYDKNGHFLGVVYLGDAALLKKGDEVLLFLESSFSDSYDYRLVGECGKWFLGDDGQYRCGLLFDTRFPHSFTPRIGLKDYAPVSEEQINDWISK